MTHHSWKSVFCILLMVSVSGCGTLNMQPSGRSGTEQLMSAISIQESLNQLNLKQFISGKTVTFTVTGHSDEIDYITKIIPSYLSRWEAKPVLDNASPDLSLTFVVDAAGTDIAKGGLALPIILPSLTNGITLSQIDVGTVTEQWNTCRLWVYITNPNGNVVYISDPAYEGLWIKNFNLLGLSLGRTKNFDETQDTHE